MKKNKMNGSRKISIEKNGYVCAACLNIRRGIVETGDLTIPHTCDKTMKEIDELMFFSHLINKTKVPEA